MTMTHKYYPLNRSNKESWNFAVYVKSYDVKWHSSLPYNFSSQFIVMKVTNISGTVVTSAYTPSSTSAMYDGLSGKAILTFPTSATSGVSAGMYEYSIYLTDWPVAASATMTTKIISGPLTVTD